MTRLGIDVDAKGMGPPPQGFDPLGFYRQNLRLLEGLAGLDYRLLGVAPRLVARGVTIAGWQAQQESTGGQNRR